MRNFNLSDWALRHRSLVWYFMIVFAIAGAYSYSNLGRAEDPDFTIKTMIIAASWDGATIEDTMSQVTDRIEKKLEELDSFDYTHSITRPGLAIVYVYLKPSTAADAIPATWDKIRNMINDIRPEFPQGLAGPSFNDDFGDVFGSIYAFTADGFSQRQLRDYVETVRSQVLTVPDAGKVELVGAQDEVIFLEFAAREIAAIGITQAMVVDSLRAQNSISPSGTIEADGERVSIRVSGQFTSEESLRAINLRINDRFFRLGDLATIRRGYVDPPKSLFRYNGEPAIGLAVGMKSDGNLLSFGEALEAEMRKIEAELPIGIDVDLVSDQPKVAEEAVSGFVKALVEAVVIVMAVSFISLGLRAGLVVAVTIPLVLAITFVVMDLYGVGLQRISLGALIIALGLLVDDAMIAVEMMVARLESGDSLESAATYVYTSTAFPMLTGTLVTVASFFPVAFNTSSAGEYTFTLFVVMAASLIVSWIVAVLFVPLLGVTMLPRTMKQGHSEKGGLSKLFSSLLLFCLRRKWLTIAATVGLFAVSIYGSRFVEQQFFPLSDRTELLVDFTLPQNASITETRELMDRFEENALAGDADITHQSSYVGQGAVRFLLSFDVPPRSPNFGQIVIVSRSLEARDRLRDKLEKIAARDFVGTDVFVHPLEIGPPVGRPVQYRISGPDIQRVRDLAQKVARILGENGDIGGVVYDWNEPARVVKVDVMQDKAAQFGVTSETIATALNGVVGGAAATQIRDDIYLVDVIGRARESDRSSIETLQNLQIPTSSGVSLPLAAVANFRYESEQPIVWRRDRLPTITVEASVEGAVQPSAVVAQLEPELRPLIDSLSAGYKITTGGSVEKSAEGQGPIVAVVPIMILIMTTILMFQLQSFQRLFLVVIVAPLGWIGVVTALLLGQAPLGFVAILGILALIGILIRNSVILVIQIEQHRQEGMSGWDAVIAATEHRTRPILLTAAAASLALIPIASEVFWGPMAFAMMGGIIVGTVLTLLFLPALYVVWFRLSEPRTERAGSSSGDASVDPLAESVQERAI